MTKEPLVAKLLMLPAFQEIDQSEFVPTEEQKEREMLRLAALLRDLLLSQLPNVQKPEE